MATTSNAPAVFSSVHMRERDKIIREKHDQELSALHSKVNRLRHSNDDLRKQIYDVEERATRLSRALGFEDFVDAQIFISTTDQEVSYTECFDQVGLLKGELEVANFEVEGLKAQVSLAERTREEFKAKLDGLRKLEQEARKSYSVEAKTVKVQMSELQKQYDDLQNKFQRATSFYKADYKKWRKFNAWLFSDCEDDKSVGGGGVRISATVMRKKRKLQEMLDDDSDTDCPPPLGGLTNPYLEDAEGQATVQHVQIPQPRPFPVSSLTLSPSPTRHNTPAPPDTNATAMQKPFIGLKKADNMPVHSPSIFLDVTTGSKSTRGSVVYKPVPDAISRLREPEPSPSRPGRTEEDNKDDAVIDGVVIASSETEEDSRDSQSLPTASRTVPVLPSLPCSSDSEQDLDEPLQQHDVVFRPTSTQEAKPTKIPATSSDTEPDTQQSESQAQHNASSSPLLPVFKMPKVPKLTYSSDNERDIQQVSSPLNLALPTPKSLARPAAGLKPGKRDATNEARNGPMEPPLKVRRVDNTQTPKRSFSFHRSKTSPRPASRKALAGNHERFASQSSKRGKKGENKENAMLLAGSSPIRSAKISKTPLQDYSAFKGRGRYAKDVNSPTKTINAIYAIDSSRNGGVEHPYDEVVRRKKERKKMDAGDCECCHDYYDAVGPLPSRMQPPLWRSPETKKKTGSSCSTRKHKRHTSDLHAHFPLDSSFDSQQPQISRSGSSTEQDYSKIEEHKRLISRHRHHWARAVTPPGYWDIGFPDTQETENINEKAKEMHRKKQVEVDRSVRVGEGKYRRR